MAEHTTVSDNIGTRLLFENDRVRVWDLQLAPGESIGLHRHNADYLYIVIGDGSLQGVDADGSRRPPQARSDGEVVFRDIEGEDVHGAINVGTNPWRNIIVELK
ncbi:MAG: hypothetical protein VB875_10020 [Pirellulales bacterium]